MNETIVKHLNFGEDAKKKIFEGINKLTKAVSSTLGASGKCVILEDGQGNPQITKDGVTVADSIVLLDPVENMGSKLLKEAARKTVREAGDGTTTATVLAHAILHEAMKVSDIENPRSLKNGINSAVEKVVKYLESISKEVKGDAIRNVASISANNDKELGDIIAQAFKEVNETGPVMMETNKDAETVVDVIDGIKYDRGIKNQHLINNTQSNTCELNNPLVLIIENHVESIRKIQTVLEHVSAENESILIIADVEQSVLNAITMNKLKNGLKVNIIDTPAYGGSRNDILEDISLLTGATIINEQLGDDVDLISLEHLGRCEHVSTSQNSTMIKVANYEANMDELIESINDRIKNSKHVGEIKMLENRLARLATKVAIIKVGANSEVELKEKKDRVEDAIYATKAAIKEGIVPGGGIALLNAAQNITAKSNGEQVLLNAIRSPYLIILENAGIAPTEEVLAKGRGLDVVTGKTVNMVKSGIIDPLLVTKSALRNAASVATTILSTDCVINNLRV